MDKKRIAMLLLVSSGGLAVAGIIFLVISMFGYRNGWSLCTAMVCVLLSNLFNIIRCQLHKRTEEE